MAVAFQLGIDNTSPTITYSPFPNTVALNATAGWTPYYTDSGFPSTSGLVGDGTSLQISSNNGSFFSLTWFGTGIDLYGNATLAAFQVSLNHETGGASSGNALVDSASNLLASFSNLQLDTYTVTLTAQTSSLPSSFIAFDRAVITSAVEVENLNNVTVHSEMVDDTSIAYKGQWSFQEYPPDGYVHATSRLGDSAQLTFNGTAVSVFGLRNPAAGYYNVTLDGGTTQYDASSVWNESAMLFYMTGLDPQRTHSLTITNAANNLLAVGHVNTTLVSGVPISTSGIPKDTIAGIVVGVVLGVVVFPILGFFLWRWRRRRRRKNERDFNFIEPSIHKGFDIAEVLDIQPGGLGQRGKPPTQSPTSDVSLDLFPVTIPQLMDPQSKTSPPTFPRSPTTSSLSRIQRPRDSSSGGVVHSPEAADQSLSTYIRDSLQIDLEDTLSSGIHRRSTIPRPSGPRPPSYRFSNDDPRLSAVMPISPTLMDSNPAGRGEYPEPEMQQINEGRGSTIYSFLDMNPPSGPPSTIDNVGQSRNPDQPVPHVNLESPPRSVATRSDSARSHRDSDRRRESGTSKPLTLSVVIEPPTLKYPPATEPHPYSPYSRINRLTPQFLRPRTGERISPTESIPFTTSEVSEIRFSHPGDSGEPSASRPGSGSDPQPSPLRATAATSHIYRKLFGTPQGEVPQDGKRPIHRKALSSSTFGISSKI